MFVFNCGFSTEVTCAFPIMDKISNYGKEF